MDFGDGRVPVFPRVGNCNNLVYWRMLLGGIKNEHKNNVASKTMKRNAYFLVRGCHHAIQREDVNSLVIYNFYHSASLRASKEHTF
jgi:hypothetical protein